jgi:hypothetical protein
MATASASHVVIDIGFTPTIPKHLLKTPCALGCGQTCAFGTIRCADHKNRCATCCGTVEKDIQLVCGDCWRLGKLPKAKKPAVLTEAFWVARAVEEGEASSLSSPASPDSEHTVIGFR